MNGAHLHLIINHSPIYAAIFGFLILLIGIIKKSQAIKNIGLLLFVIMALATIPTFLSGERSPKIVREMPGVTRAYIHEHAEAGLYALYSAEILGALALLTLILSRRAAKAPQWLYVLCLLLSLAVNAIMVRTANLGGEIRHTEIRPDFQPADPSVIPGNPEKPEVQPK